MMQLQSPCRAIYSVCDGSVHTSGAAANYTLPCGVFCGPDTNVFPPLKWHRGVHSHLAFYHHSGQRVR